MDTSDTQMAELPADFIEACMAVLPSNTHLRELLDTKPMDRATFERIYNVLLSTHSGSQKILEEILGFNDGHYGDPDADKAVWDLYLDRSEKLLKVIGSTMGIFTKMGWY